MTTGLMFPKPEASCLRKAAIRKEEQKAERVAYAAVTRRDGRRCRYCGRPANEHHHIIPKSKGGRSITRNLVLLCGGEGRCHQLVQQHVINIGGNPDCMGGLLFHDTRTDTAVAR